VGLSDEEEDAIYRKAEVAVLIMNLKRPTASQHNIEKAATQLLLTKTEEQLTCLLRDAQKLNEPRARFLSVLEAYRDFSFRTCWERLPLDI
jgi:hypothetical protein